MAFTKALDEETYLSDLAKLAGYFNTQVVAEIGQVRFNRVNDHPDRYAEIVRRWEEEFSPNLAKKVPGALTAAWEWWHQKVNPWLWQIHSDDATYAIEWFHDHYPQRESNLLKQAEAKLAESEQLYTEAVEESERGTIVTNDSHKLVGAILAAKAAFMMASQAKWEQRRADEAERVRLREEIMRKATLNNGKNPARRTATTRPG